MSSAEARKRNHQSRWQAKVQAAAAAKSGRCLSTYVNARTRIEFKCEVEEHPSWKTYPQHVFNGHWCPHCRATNLRENLQGKVFGRLVAQKWVPGKTRRQRGWLCKCECGKTTIVRPDMLKTGHTKSCGCLQPSHTLLPGHAAAKRTFSGYMTDARRRGFSFELPFDGFLAITRQNCHYCGAAPANVSKRARENGIFVYNGVDRVDSKIGYELENVVPCCKVCNRAKSDMSCADFMAWIERLAQHRDHLHVHGIFCDGQDGMSSQCAKTKRKGPPDVITRLGGLT